MITLRLPFPPSCNTYWRHIVSHGRPKTLISEAGRKYQREVADLAFMQIAIGAFPTERLRVDIVAFPPDKRRRDLDNLGKSLLDALTKAGVWTDDAQIDSLHFERGDVFKGGKVTVYVREDTARTPMESPAAPEDSSATRPGFISAADYRAQGGKRKGGRG